MESIQYGDALRTAWVIRGTLKKRLCQELGLESLQSRRWLRKLSHFYIIIKDDAWSFKLDSKAINYKLNTSSRNVIKVFFKNSYLLFRILLWNNLNSNIRASPSYSIIQKRILALIRSHLNSIFNVPNSLNQTQGYV